MRLGPGARVVVRSPWSCYEGRAGTVESRHARLDGWMVRLDGEAAPLFFGSGELRGAEARDG